jgi:hypothetical protein
MPRPERAVDPSEGPVQQFAADLRVVREKAGSPKYLTMARRTGRSKTALAEAAGGDRLATWETVEAYLTACDQDPAAWRERWEQVREHVGKARGPKSTAPASPLPQVDGPSVPRRPRRRRLLFGLGALVLAAVAAWGGAALAGGSGRAQPAGSTGGQVTVVVQNKVASGPDGFYEDVTPEYLSSKTEPRCSHGGCEIANTSMWSGAVLTALCQTQGSEMTNANTGSAGIGQNPNASTSTRWYEVEMPTGVTGYISEVYLTAASRGGLGLPACPP